MAVLFSPGLDVSILSSTEVETGRALVVRASIAGIIFVFVNVYAPNQGPLRTDLFLKLKDVLRQYNQDECIVMGGLELYCQFLCRQDLGEASSSVICHSVPGDC